ncbi:hypothetical protein MBEHAL_2307 [Halarchaeum acidiphilum MH1-52-1]|uniref:DUF2975 domain-containing protein n=1 Tax=Halarchaeum acidiphilum MH1-52-1 TaxID=1261545 RepID=U2YXM2_9EURY|nr:hypothetical protein [Halarchaeum acidiphilum]GAD53547.1 hypothetical protein MBEHAL_2307 [Halarchaeum acidiphilum MH1-52-1]
MLSERLPAAVERTPLQAAKFVGVLAALALSVLGFTRVLSGPGLLFDGQFLALVLTPLVALALVTVVCCETLYSVSRVIRSDATLAEQVSGRIGYVLLRGVEAAIGVGGALFIASLVPALVDESTPAPAGVGITLIAMAVGLGILVASLVRAAAELFVYGDE